MDDSSEFRVFATSGDASVFDGLVRRWEMRLYRLAYRVTGDHAVAEDVVQTVFLRLVDRRTELSAVECFDAWIQRTTVNESINSLRRSRRREARNGEVALRLDDRREGSGEPVDSVVREEERERLGRALARLAPDQRALLALRFDEDLTFQKIADVLGRPLSTVKSQVERAIRALRKSLGQCGAG